MSSVRIAGVQSSTTSPMSRDWRSSVKAATRRIGPITLVSTMWTAVSRKSGSVTSSGGHDPGHGHDDVEVRV